MTTETCFPTLKRSLPLGPLRGENYISQGMPLTKIKDDLIGTNK